MQEHNCVAEMKRVQKAKGRPREIILHGSVHKTRLCIYTGAWESDESCGPPELALRHGDTGKSYEAEEFIFAHILSTLQVLTS